MVPYQISLDPEVVQGLLTHNDGLAVLIQSVLNQVLQAQVTELQGRHERRLMAFSAAMGTWFLSSRDTSSICWPPMPPSSLIESR